mmetsp:Transcript_542/g.1187  ORF Transcript_542/g.1187 Transcript_542/m.1187 type:complete len:468 (-) Transcript_542:301-1704(-)
MSPSSNPAESFDGEFIGKWIGRNFFFSDLLESDTRSPCMTFSMPESLLRLLRFLERTTTITDDDADGGIQFGLLAPQLQFWLALGSTLVWGLLFNTCISLLVYNLIVLPRKRGNKNRTNKQNNNAESSLLMTPYLVGFGIIMPLCAISPYYALRYFGIRNKIIKFFMGIAQLTSFFRCSEAMFGFLPAHVDDSLKNLIIYAASPVEVKFNSNGPLKSTWTHAKDFLVNLITWIIVLGMYSSILLVYDYQPFPKAEGPALQDIKLGTGFSPQQLINNLSCVILLQVYLTTFGAGLKFIASICGFQVIPIMLNPIFESSSPSDFWGRRWNLVVHGILKRGVYKPVRTKFSRSSASLATFLASGIFHEWLLSVVFYPDSEDGTCSPICYTPGYGRTSLFFVWNAILIGFEYAVGGAAIFQLFRKHLPLTVVSLMVTSTALPVAHWFTNDYVRSDYFNDAQAGFPFIVKVE